MFERFSHTSFTKEIDKRWLMEQSFSTTLFGMLTKRYINLRLLISDIHSFMPSRKDVKSISMSLPSGSNIRDKSSKLPANYREKYVKICSTETTIQIPTCTK